MELSGDYGDYPGAPSYDYGDYPGSHFRNEPQYYTDPLLPPDLFSYEQMRFIPVRMLYIIGLYVTASSSTFITHSFMVKGMMVGVSGIRNKKIQSAIGPVLISAAKCWPRFLIGMFGHFIGFSWIGEYSVLGSIAFNLHIGVALYLFANKGPHPKLSCCFLFGNLSIVLTSLAFAFIISLYSSSWLIKIALGIACFVFYGILAFLNLLYNKEEERDEEHEMEIQERKQNKSSNNVCCPEVPVSILTHGTGFDLFIDWCLYIHCMTTSLIPFLTLFWCNPSNKKWACLWPFAVVMGGVWVTFLMYLAGWWATVLGNSVGSPPEMTGLFVLGPLLSVTNLVHLADSKRTFLWKGITEDILADTLFGLTVPSLFATLFGYGVGLVTDELPWRLPWVLITINVVFSHLGYGLMGNNSFRIFYGILLLVIYPVVFLSGSAMAIYGWIG